MGVATNVLLCVLALLGSGGLADKWAVMTGLPMFIDYPCVFVRVNADANVACAVTHEWTLAPSPPQAPRIE